MNPKFKTVENTVVTQSDILYQGQLPSISNKYQVLRGRYVFSSSAAGNYALLDDNGGLIRIDAGSYIDKVVAYSGTATSGGVLTGAGATLNVGLASINTLSPLTVNAVGTALLSGSAAGATGPGVNKSDPSSAAAYPSDAPIADVVAGVSCHPDLVVSSGTVNFLAVTTASASITGALNVLVFVATQ